MGHCVSGIVCRGEESRYIRLCVTKNAKKEVVYENKYIYQIGNAI